MAAANALTTSTATPTPRRRCCAGASPSAATSRRGRVAVGNGSCEILLAAAEAMLEPGAEIVYAWPSFSMYPHLAAMSGARGVRVPLDAAGLHDLEAMARGGQPRHPHRAGLQPQQPHGHGAAAGRDRGLRGRAAQARRGDPRRGLRGVLAGPGPRRVARPAAPPLQPGRAAHLLEGLRPLRPARRLRAGLRAVPPARWTACASRSRSTRPPRRPRRRRSCTRTRWRAASS